jgi:hypothetical protein
MEYKGKNRRLLEKVLNSHLRELKTKKVNFSFRIEESMFPANSETYKYRVVILYKMHGESDFKTVFIKSEQHSKRTKRTRGRIFSSVYKELISDILSIGLKTTYATETNISKDMTEFEVNKMLERNTMETIPVHLKKYPTLPAEAFSKEELLFGTGDWDGKGVSMKEEVDHINDAEGYFINERSKGTDFDKLEAKVIEDGKKPNLIFNVKDETLSNIVSRKIKDIFG